MSVSGWWYRFLDRVVPHCPKIVRRLNRRMQVRSMKRGLAELDDLLARLEAHRR